MDKQGSHKGKGRRIPRQMRRKKNAFSQRKLVKGSELGWVSKATRNLKTKRGINDNRPFPSCPGPLFQNEGRCSAFDMEIIFHSHAKKTHFHKKGCALSLILKVRVFGTRKWPIGAISKHSQKFQTVSGLTRGHINFGFQCGGWKSRKGSLLTIS